MKMRCGAKSPTLAAHDVPRGAGSPSLPAAVALGVGRMLFLSFRKRARRRWRADIARRFHLDATTLDEIEQTIL
jgi:hypothetical protein